MKENLMELIKSEHGVRADPLVPIYKRMVAGKTVCQLCCLLLK